MSMKSKIKIIVSLAAALLAAGIVAYVLYGKRVDEWRQVAGQTLRNAVGEEVAKRTGQPFYFAANGVYKQLEERDYSSVCDSRGRHRQPRSAGRG